MGRFAKNSKSKKALALALALMLLFSLFTQSVFAAGKDPKSDVPVYLNPTAPVESRVNDLLGRMTLDEKVGQMVQPEKGNITPDDVKNYYIGSVFSGGGSFPGNGTEADSTQANWSALYDSLQDGAVSTRLGIPLLYGVDAVHGHNNVKGATIFPQNIGLGAARDTKLVEKIGSAVAAEVRSTGVNYVFAPTIADPQNIKWGRTYEGFGENLDLVAQMGVAYIKGFQGDRISDLKGTDKVVATAKHYMGEGWTDNGSNQGNISALTKEEVASQLIQPYQDAVNAGVRSVMVSYNSVQGVKCHASKYLITDVLKSQLKFDGFVISDYNGIEQISIDESGNAVSGLKAQVSVAVNAGIDMLMETGNWKNCINYIKELVIDEQALAGSGIPMSRIDDAVKRILRVKFQAGVFENVKTNPDLSNALGSEKNREIARQAVRESLVLLKNDMVNGTPILAGLRNMNNIFVTGSNADNLGNQCGGWTITWQGESGNTHTTGTTILKGIQDALKDTGKTVAYNKNGRVPAGTDVAIVVVGETPYAEGNGDTANLELIADDQATIQNVKDSGVPMILVIVSGRPMIINNYLGDCEGIIEAWLPGTEGSGVADVLFSDKYDFIGKLPVKWPFYLEALPISDNSSPYVLFPYGYGLTKQQATPALPDIPQKPAGSLPDGVTPVPVPGTVEAENPFAVNGWDISNPTNNFIEYGAPRSNNASVGWTSTGKWLKYLVDVTEAGWYKAEIGLASPSGASNAIQLLDGNGNVLTAVSAVSTGGWAAFGPVNAYVQLESGPQVIEFYCVAGGFNFDCMTFTKADGPPEPPVTPPFEETAPVVEGGSGAVQSWMTSEKNPGDGYWYWKSEYTGGEKKLEQQPAINITSLDKSDATTINIDPNQQYQTMTGMGTSFDGSSINNLSKMSPDKRMEVLRQMFDPDEGIGITMMRATIGTADFTSGDFYSYDDMPAGQTDLNLSNFSIARDKEDGKNIIQAIKDAQQIAEEHGVDLRIVAAPWSPPGWMKTSDSLIRGQIKDEYLPVLAQYYLKYLTAYKAEGIDIDLMSLQNEPLLEIDYPSCRMTWQQEAQLAKLLRAAIDDYNLSASDDNKLSTQLLIFDHNPSDTMAYPAQILKDNADGAYDAVNGTAFHDYSGEMTEMTKLHNLYPDKDIYMTERAVWGTTGADRMAQYFRNWAKSYNSWVFMLDSDIATHHWTGVPGPTPIIQDAADPDNYWMLPEVYLLGQYSKFVRPGDIRVYSDYGSANTVTNVAFLNPATGKVTAVVINQTSAAQNFKMVCEGTQFGTTIPAKTVATYVWTPIKGEAPQPESSDTVDYAASKVITLKSGSDALATSGDWNIENGQLKNAGAGKWADYTINIPEAGNYYININYTGEDYGMDPNRQFSVLEGETVLGTVSCSRTGGWDPWNYKSKQIQASFAQGEHTIRLLVDNGWWIDFNTITIVKADNISAPLKVDAIQANSYDNLAINTCGDSGSGYCLGNTSAGSWMQYNVNVPVAGQYDISYRVASGTDGSQLKLEINGASTTTPAAISIDNTGWDAYGTVNHTVELPAGPVSLKIYCDSNGFNFNWFSVAFHNTVPVPSIITLKSGADAAATSGNWNIENGQLKGSEAGKWADYTINIPETGDYYINVNYAGEDYGMDPNRQFSILEGDTVLGTVACSKTGGWNPWNYKSRQIQTSFTQGEHTIRLLIDNGWWMDFDTITIIKAIRDYTVPAAIDAIQATGYSDAAVGSAGFGNTSAGSWFEYTVNINRSQNYSISYNAATDNSDARVKLLVNGDESISPNAVAIPRTGWETFGTVTDTVFLPAGTDTLRINCDTSGYNFKGFTIDPVKIQPEIAAALGYSFDGRIINISINRGIFVKANIDGITLNGESLPISYLDPTHARIKLGWDYAVNDGDTLTITVPTSAFSDSAGCSDLSCSILVQNSTNKADPMAIPGRINAEDYYQMDGITTAACSLGGQQVQVGETGGWVDYYVNVPVDDYYTLNLKIQPANGLSNALMLMEGTDILSYFNTPAVDSKWVDLRRTVALTQGLHHLKLFATSGSFNINFIEVQPRTAQEILDAQGASIRIEGESYINSNLVPVEGDKNLGYSSAGAYVDYYINVPKTAAYTVTYNYATAQSGVSVSFMDLTDSAPVELSRTNLPSTGGWASYSDAKGTVQLTAGIHTIRLVDNGDGYNTDYFTLAESTGGTAPVGKAAAPKALIRPGTYFNKLNLSLITATSGAKIYYTTDGSVPTSSSYQYTGSIELKKDVNVIRAIAVKEGMADSYMSLNIYVISPKGDRISTVERPSASLDRNKHSENQAIMLECRTKGATIYYTLDGSAPNTTSAVYTGPIGFTSPVTLKAVAVKEGMNDSEVLNLWYPEKGRH